MEVILHVLHNKEGSCGDVFLLWCWLYLEQDSWPYYQYRSKVPISTVDVREARLDDGLSSFCHLQWQGVLSPMDPHAQAVEGSLVLVSGGLEVPQELLVVDGRWDI